MTLREKQSVFVGCVGHLIARASTTGYALTFGEAWRTDEQAIINHLGAVGREQLAQLVEADGYADLAAALRNNGKGTGIVASVHMDRLAVDFNVFKDGALCSQEWQFEPLGMFWEGLHPLCRWGGRFQDYGHFSFEHEGRK
jgi:hypothetical protein